MVFSWLRSRRGRAARPCTAPGERIYAIGDIHGRDDLLRRMLALIEADVDKAGAQARARLVFLGDYVDRGPRSAAVVRQLRALQAASAAVTCLRGNHEQALLDVALGAAEERQVAGWLTYGGRETLASYGLPADLVYSSDIAAITEAAVQVLGVEDVDWLSRLPLIHASGDYLFVHAGIRPGVPLDDQVAQDLLWIREGFLDYRQSFGPLVVHGHSITRAVDRQPNRIGIDTGAYATGILTALVLEGEEQHLLQTDPAA